MQSIPASLVGEFSFTFGTEEVDHKWPWWCWKTPVFTYLFVFFLVSCFCVLGKDLTEGKPMGKKPRSSIQAAIATDELRPVECFALPMATSDRQKRWTWLAHLIQRQWQNWPGSIGVAFYRLQAWVFMCFLWYQNGSKWYDVA